MVDLLWKLLGRIRGKRNRIVIIGDVMVDRWVHGHVSTCQDGCSKFMQDRVLEVPGGAANAERCLMHWAANTSLYGMASDECPVKTRYVEDGRIVFRADDDREPAKGYDWAYDLALEMVDRAGAVLLSDYDKGFLYPEFIRAVVVRCRERRIPCVADAKREPEVYVGCTLKANLDWYVKYGSADVVTRGGDVPVVGCEPIDSMLPHVNCVNHVGAGDCFAAHLTLALAYGFSLKEAAILAHSAGRVYVQHEHNEPPRLEDIMSDLSSAM